MRAFQTIAPNNTVGQWVNAFNNNALAASDHTFYLGEILYSAVLYTGLETIGGITLSPFENIVPDKTYAKDVVFDNWYIYFKNENKINLLTDLHLDLSPWMDNKVRYLFLDYQGGYRADFNPQATDAEVRLCRFMIDSLDYIIQIYPSFPRFGSLYDNRVLPVVSGSNIVPVKSTSIGLEEGAIDYSGIRFDYHPFPDYIKLDGSETAMTLHYTDGTNCTDYKTSSTIIDTSKYWDMTNQNFRTTTTGKYINIRVFLDFYTNRLVLQRGSLQYDSLRDAMDAIYAMVEPFPYEDSNMYPMLGIICIKCGCTDVTDEEVCRFINFRPNSSSIVSTENFSTDEYARSKIITLEVEVDDLKERVSTLEQQMIDINDRLNNHMGNIVDSRNTPYLAGVTENPHSITALKLGLDSYTPYTPETLPLSDPTKTYVDSMISGVNTSISGLTSKYLRKDQNDSTLYTITAAGLTCTAQYITINSLRWYVGILPSGAPDGSYGVKT